MTAAHNGVRGAEVMTGFEYCVAIHLLQEGMTRDGLKVVRDIGARYNGRKRNPLNEAECGHHYAARWQVGDSSPHSPVFIIRHSRAGYGSACPNAGPLGRGLLAMRGLLHPHAGAAPPRGHLYHASRATCAQRHRRRGRNVRAAAPKNTRSRPTGHVSSPAFRLSRTPGH